MATDLDRTVPIAPGLHFRGDAATPTVYHGCSAAVEHLRRLDFAATHRRRSHTIRVLHDLDISPRHRSPWRDDACSIADLVTDIADYRDRAKFACAHRFRGCPCEITAHLEFACTRIQLEHAIAAALASGQLTGRGRHHLQQIERTIIEWHDEYVPNFVEHLAIEATSAHEIYWRIRNLRPAPETIESLAHRYTRGAQPPTELPTAQLTHPSPEQSRRGCGLARALTRLPRIGDVTRADRAYTMGRYDIAAHRYRRSLTEAPTDPSTWAGLALAMTRTDPRNELTLLFERPEVVARFYAIVLGTRHDRGLADALRWLGGATRHTLSID
ncbi:hypothetical protein JK358_35715 [Nocardia sp. 2]|uniref:Uncharacterized protein n=1 Tax=Nocardia acididurans TaxID=2802282 RepID=A0ABS1MKI0_9NOCA|nr:hypothetical protein [Nocardia acididurans]MBL1079763.1 hypothetical protein [Nocardia acididurans]